MSKLLRILILVLPASFAFAQPPAFKIQIPDFGDRVSDADTIEIPGKHPQALLLRVLNPLASEVDYGKIQTKLNGEGAGYITTVTNSADGKVVRMDLKLREGVSLVPGTNTVEILATNRRGRKFYKNFLLKTREEARNEYFSYEVKRAPGDDKGAPPQVVIVEPPVPVVFGPKERLRKVLVKGNVSSVQPLKTLQVQGSEVKQEKNVFDFEKEVQVSPADTKITVEATDQMGNRTTVTIPVGKSAVSRPVQIQGDRYALVIGISQYSAKPGLPGLPSAGPDAQNFAATLQSQAGFKKENVYLLTDAEAKHALLRNAFRNFTARPGPDDLLIVFFAGYGLHDPLDPSGIYLAAHDTQLGQVAQTALSIEDLKTLIGSSVRSRQMLLLFDVDHPVTGEWASRNNNLVNDYLLRMFPGDAGKAVMVGSSVNEIALEHGGQSGLFAHHLVEAARGQADWNQDGIVTVHEWFLQVSRAVKAESRGAQTPRFSLQQPEKAIFAMAK